jgi:hypothetical protein
VPSNFRKFGMTFVYKVKDGERWSVLFLEHHKSKGMNQEEERGRTTSKAT